MNIADTKMGLGPQAHTVLALLATREPTWARALEKAMSFDVSFDTTAYYGRLEGFALRMWPNQDRRGGVCYTLVVGEHHADGLCLETWGWIKDQDRPRPDDRPFEALQLVANSDASAVVEAVVRELREVYEEARPQPRTIYDHLDV